MPAAILILAALAARPAPAEAALPDILIPQLRLGMDKQQFHALWPKYRAQFGPGCIVKINADIRDHKLHGVALESPEKEPNLACGKFVAAWAHAAFGKPYRDGEGNDLGNCGSGGFGSGFRDMASPCGTPDVTDWATWRPNAEAYWATVSAARKDGQWSFSIYPRA